MKIARITTLSFIGFVLIFCCFCGALSSPNAKVDPAPVVITATPRYDRTLESGMTVVSAKQTQRSIPSSTIMPTYPPMATTAPTGQCNDGNYTYADSPQGACSWHGGVDKWWGK
jgi:hypothetical protein